MLALLALAAYLGWWPVPVEPVAWHAPPAPGYVGAHAANARLAGLKRLSLGNETGPEHVAVGRDGSLFTGVASGRILRIDPQGGSPQVVANTGGRPLGLDFDATGRLIVADAVKGLLAVAPDGSLTLLADVAGGAPIRFADGVVVAGNGKIYVTDASAHFAPTDHGGTMAAATLDVIEQSATGRVLEYDPASGIARVVAQGLSFPNGIVMSTDQQTLLVAESGRYRIWTIAANASELDVRTAAAQSQARVLLDNLPGYPDNLTRGRNGRIWLGLSGQRNDLDAMADKPFLRKVMLRIPRAAWPVPKPYAHVMALTEDGAIVEDLQDGGAGAAVTTGATETAQRLYIHNVSAGELGWIER